MDPKLKIALIVCFTVILIVILTCMGLMIEKKKNLKEKKLAIIAQLSNDNLNNDVITADTILPKNIENGINIAGVILKNNQIAVADNLDTREYWVPTIGDGTNNFTTSYAKGGLSRFGNCFMVTLTVFWTSLGRTDSLLPVRISLPFTVIPIDSKFSISFSIGQISNITYYGTLVACADAGTNFIYLRTIYPNNGPSSIVNVSSVTPLGNITLSGIVPT